MRQLRFARQAIARLWPCAALAATVVALGAVAVGGAGSAAAATHTKTTIFNPFTYSGKPASHVDKTLRGYCWTGSLASDRADAWRCMVGNEIIDPCFSSAKAGGIVLCSANGSWSSSLLEVELTKKLPSKYANKGKPSTSGLPWALLTTADWKCELDTGATTAIHGMRLNYFCKGTKDGLWGSPSRKSQPWQIYAAPSTAKTLSSKVGIGWAWF
jgi:hypothetical protein